MLGAHLGVFSVLQRLRSVILTSLPPLSCQSPLPRSKRLTLLSWAVSIPGAKSKKHTYHVYLSVSFRFRLCLLLCASRTRTCILGALSLLVLAIDVMLRRFSGGTVTLFLCFALLCFLWGWFVSFRFVSFRFFVCLLCALCCAIVCFLGVFFVLERDIIFDFVGGVARINQSTNQPYLFYLFCLV